MVNRLVELLRAGGTYILLHRLWDSFQATLGPDNQLYALNWSKDESLVTVFASVQGVTLMFFFPRFW